jgi:hypothetical protein
MTRSKLWVLLFLAIALVALVVLAAGIAGLTMPPGTPFTLATGDRAAQIVTPVPLSDAQMSTLARLIRIGMVVILALLPFSIIYMLLTKEGRRRLLPNLILFALLLLLARNLSGSMRATTDLNFLRGAQGLGANELGALPPPSEFSGAVPAWLTAFTSLTLAAFAVLMIGLLVWGLSRRRGQPAPMFLEQIAEEAQGALAALQAGGDLRNAIIRAYREMNRVVFEARGVARAREVTPHEFEQQLQRAGLPAEPVHDLTHLFEEARYGAKEMGAAEEALAVASLTAIIAACAEGKPANLGAPLVSDAEPEGAVWVSGSGDR